jgi:hypothetical protein
MADGEKCIWEIIVENNLVIQTRKLMSPIKETKSEKLLGVYQRNIVDPLLVFCTSKNFQLPLDLGGLVLG